jgi:hypothetical protein
MMPTTPMPTQTQPSANISQRMGDVAEDILLVFSSLGFIETERASRSIVITQ